MRLICLVALTAATLFVVPAQAQAADTMSPLLVQGMASFVRAKATYTPLVSAWPTASPIIYGQTLANSTLTGGTVNVSGTFAFDDTSIQPPAGTYTAAVTFTPTDTENYNSVPGTVDVTVTTATPGDYTLVDYLGIPLLALLALGIVRLAEMDRMDGPCFIATAAWGTPMAPEVDRLREFRDNTLLAGVAGTALVDVYYRVSPAIADAVAASPALAALVRLSLIPVVFLVSLPAPLVTGLTLLASILLLRRILRRRNARRRSAGD